MEWRVLGPSGLAAAADGNLVDLVLVGTLLPAGTRSGVANEGRPTASRSAMFSSTAVTNPCV